MREGAERLAPRYIGVVGTSDDSASEACALAEEVGRLLAGRGAIVVTGGLTGVMAAACRGAVSAGGMTVGLLPGMSRSDGNPFLTVSVPTGLGELRNGLIVRSSEALIAIGGGWGTLSEIALAARTGVPVIGLQIPFRLPELEMAAAASEAVEKALTVAR